MKTIRCPYCAGIICKAQAPPVEGRCGSCHRISLYDGSCHQGRARPMTQGEVQAIKETYHLNRRQHASKGTNRP